MSRKGFTLIEFLVVVAIIAVLVAILLPALKAALDQARNMVCLNNVKEIATAMIVYAENYGGYFPDTPFDDHVFMTQGTIAGMRWGGDTAGTWTDWGILYMTNFLGDGRLAFCPRDTRFRYDEQWHPRELTKYIYSSYYSRNWHYEQAGYWGITIRNVNGKSSGHTPTTSVTTNEQLARRSLIADEVNFYREDTWGSRHDNGINVGWMDGSAKKFEITPEETRFRWIPWWGTEGRMFPDVFDKRQ